MTEPKSRVTWTSRVDESAYHRLLRLLFERKPKAPNATTALLNALPLPSLLVGIPALIQGLEELSRWN